MRNSLYLLITALFTLNVGLSQNLFENAKAISIILSDPKNHFCEELDQQIKLALSTSSLDVSQLTLINSEIQNFTKNCKKKLDLSVVKKEIDSLQKLHNNALIKLEKIDSVISSNDEQIYYLKAILVDPEKGFSHGSLQNYNKGFSDMNEKAAFVSEYLNEIESQNRELSMDLLVISIEAENIKSQITTKGNLLSDQPVSTLSSSITSLGSISSIFSSPTIAIDGTVQFLTERTRDELNMAFINKFRQALENYDEVPTLFPAVSSVVLNNDPLNFSIWGNQLQLAAKTDIKNLPQNFYIFLQNNPTYKALSIKGDFEIFVTLLNAINLQSLGSNPINTLLELNEIAGYKTKSAPDNINLIISLLQAVSESFLIHDNKITTYVSSNDIFKMSLLERKVFISLFSIKNKELLSAAASKISESISEDQINYLFVYSSKLSNMFATLKPAIDTLTKENSLKQSRINAYKTINNYLVTLYELGFEIYNYGDANAMAINSGNYIKIKPIIYNSVQLTNSLLDENYSAALMAFTNLASVTMNMLIVKAEKDIKPEEAQKVKKTIETIIYWGGFLAEIASIDTTVNVKEFLKKYAEPVGSYRIKRNSLFSVSVNSFPGIYSGLEKLDTTTAFGYGITVPIGLCFSIGSRKDAIGVNSSDDFDFISKKNKDYRKLTGRAFYVYFPIIDVGAPFVYRWSSDSTQGFPGEIQWEDIFAPGAYFGYGFKNYGFSVMGGFQVAPALRKITENGLEFNAKALRYGLTFTYDIPIFTLYRKTEPKNEYP